MVSSKDNAVMKETSQDDLVLKDSCCSETVSPRRRGMKIVLMDIVEDKVVIGVKTKSS